MDINKIAEENKKLKNDLEQKNNEIQKLKSDITNYINEINKLKNEIQKLNSDLNVYINENQKLKNINNANIANRPKSLDSGKPAMEELKIKDNKINELKDLIPIIFQSKDQKIIYAIICRTTDKFKEIEAKFYEKFPELEDSDNFAYFFTIKGKKAKKGKTIAENNINNSDIVVINKIEIKQD
jgi:chromosome segregation ATPase